MTEGFQILKGADIVNPNPYFKHNTKTRTRGQTVKNEVQIDLAQETHVHTKSGEGME